MTPLLGSLLMATLAAAAPARDVVQHRADAERTARYHLAPVQRPIEAWTATLPAESFGTPLVSGDVMIAGGSDGTLYALDPRTGATRWTVTGFEAMENGTVIAGDVVLAAGMSKQVRALALVDGAERWSFAAGAFVFAPPAVIEGVAYVATYEKIFALALADGHVLWQAPTLGQMAFVSAPACTGDLVVVAAGTRLVAFDRATGAERWRIDAPVQFWNVAVDRDLAYVGNADGTFRAYALESGLERWRFRSTWAASDDIWSAPALGASTVYAGSRDGNLYALDPRTGEKRWAFPTGGDAVGDPVIANGALYVSDSNHLLPPGVRRLYALDPVTGGERWRWETSGTILGNPAPDKRVLYVPLAGRIVALTD
jgi:outer membrane protein assembly factor BamB